MTRMPPANNRISFLKNAVQNFKPGICTERAVLWTNYFKNPKNKNKPVCIQIAEAFRDVLLKKTVRIYPCELIVGNFTAKRVGGQITPELLGVPVMQDIFQISPAKNQSICRFPRLKPGTCFAFCPSGCPALLPFGLINPL